MPPEISEALTKLLNCGWLKLLNAFDYLIGCDHLFIRTSIQFVSSTVAFSSVTDNTQSALWPW